MKSKLDWTSLPGSEQFLNRVEGCIRRTRSVIAFVPACTNGSWEINLKDRIGKDFIWRELRCGATNFLGEVSNRKDGREFIHCSEMIPAGVEQHVFFIREVKAVDWPAWESLLVRFSEAQRSESEFKRNVMLIHLRHNNFSEPVGAQFDSCSLHDHLRAEDAYFAACRFMQGGESKILEEEIRVHVAAELALWDFELCNFLCDSKLTELLNPQHLLLRYAEIQKGEDQTTDAFFKPAWSSGKYNRKPPVHSVLVARSGNINELNRRVWRGQVQTLFPLIEEQRCLLIEQLRKRAPAILRLFNEADGPIEIGPLHAAMCGFQKCPADLKKLAWHLKEMRNELAHLRVCQPRILPKYEDLLR